MHSANRNRAPGPVPDDLTRGLAWPRYSQPKGRVEMPSLPLPELRVVEVGSGDALGYCGKLFADFGAEVFKIEPSGGDAARNIAPLVDAGDDRRESGYFAWLNTNKRSLTAEQSLLPSWDACLDTRWRYPD
jgi:hypothetical protein